MRSLILFFTLFFWLTAYANNFAESPDVKAFINHMVKKYDFNKAELITIFSAVKFRPKVTQHVKSPLEYKPWYTYKNLYVTDRRIYQGVKFWNEHQEALAQAEKTYGVPASIIVATIGIESKYGKHTGEFLVIDALTNLAFGDTSRAPFFRKELEEFLLLAKEQHLDPLKVTGSYAGAIGQPQFMPSSYRYYAVSFSDNTTIDLKHNEADAIASVANYYKKNGWKKFQPIAVPLKTTGGKYQTSFAKPKQISLYELIEYGFVPDTRALRDQKYKILLLRENFRNEYWLTYHNFNVIKRYNHSELYAMAVYQLSYYITALRERENKKHV